MSATETIRRRRLHPAWIVAAVAFLALVGAAGFRAAPGVLMVPLQQEFGWSTTVLSAAVSINLVLFGLTAPFAAALMEKFGIRAVTATALVLIGAGSALTVLVTFAGAAGIYAFEHEAPGGPHSYGEALWWTAMIMTTMGSQYWPHTIEGRVLCVFLALYAFGVFGYVTATLATFFVGRDAESDEAEVAGAKQLAALRAEVSALRQDIQDLSRRLEE